MLVSVACTPGMARLEQEGVIVGYTLRLKPEEEVHQIRAIMSLAVESNREEAVMPYWPRQSIRASSMRSTRVRMPSRRARRSRSWPT